MMTDKACVHRGLCTAKAASIIHRRPYDCSARVAPWRLPAFPSLAGGVPRYRHDGEAYGEWLSARSRGCPEGGGCGLRWRWDGVLQHLWGEQLEVGSREGGKEGGREGRRRLW